MTTSAVYFNGRAYTPEILATMTLEELRLLHNRVAALNDKEEVDMFSTPAEGQVRTWDMVQCLSSNPEPSKSTSKSPVKPTGRKMLFKFPKRDDISPPKPGTLRADVLEATRRGVTFNDVVGIVKEFDNRRGVESKNEERRAYEVIRLLHFSCGYGMEHTPEGVIKTRG